MDDSRLRDEVKTLLDTHARTTERAIENLNQNFKSMRSEQQVWQDKFEDKLAEAHSRSKLPINFWVSLVGVGITLVTLASGLVVYILNVNIVPLNLKLEHEHDLVIKTGRLVEERTKAVDKIMRDHLISHAQCNTAKE